MTQKSSPDPENRYVRASESCALLKKAYWVMVSRCPCLKYDQSGNQRAAADAAEARERIFVAVVLEIAPDYPSLGLLVGSANAGR